MSNSLINYINNEFTGSCPSTGQFRTKLLLGFLVSSGRRRWWIEVAGEKFDRPYETECASVAFLARFLFLPSKISSDLVQVWFAIHSRFRRPKQMKKGNYRFYHTTAKVYNNGGALAFNGFHQPPTPCQVLCNIAEMFPSVCI